MGLTEAAAGGGGPEGGLGVTTLAAEGLKNSGVWVTGSGALGAGAGAGAGLGAGAAAGSLARVGPAVN